MRVTSIPDRRQAGAFLFLLACASGMPLAAVDGRLADTPWQESYQNRGDVKRLTVTWGTVSETRQRTAAECHADYHALKAYLAGPEFAQVWKGILATAQQQETELAAAMVEKIRVAHEATPQNPPVPAQLERSARREALLPWQERIPLSLRGDLVLLVVDFRDERQVAWLLAQVERTPHAQAFAVGWNRHRDVSDAILAFPALANVQTVRHQGAEEGDSHAYVRWLAGWGITALPARITFADDTHTLIEEGLNP